MESVLERIIMIDNSVPIDVAFRGVIIVVSAIVVIAFRGINVIVPTLVENTFRRIVINQTRPMDTSRTGVMKVTTPGCVRLESTDPCSLLFTRTIVSVMISVEMFI